MEHITREQFATIIQNESLIESVPSLDGIDQSLFTGTSGSIYYGTGLTTPHALSIGLPFDVLGMVLVAEKLRRTLGLTEIIHHIADTHALANPFATQEAVEKIAGEVIAVMEKIAAHVKIPQLTIVRSSSFDCLPEYRDILNGIQTEKGEYVRRELADMCWYKRRHNLRLKLGWIIQATQAEERFDERLYDNEYKRLFGNDLSCMYIKAGRTFDTKRPKASPYISVLGEDRVLLRAGEPAWEKCVKAKERRDQYATGALNHLAAIVRLYERLVEPLPRGDVGEKVEAVIHRIFGTEGGQ